MNNANGGNVIYHFKGDTKNLDTATKDVSSKLGGLKGVGKGVALGVAGAVVGATSAVIGMTKKSVEAYASVEQSIGGVETLFKDSADKVIANSKKAYETAGLDADTYMQQITSFSASLLQSLGGDTQKAAEVGDMAIRDMSDNANKFGTSIDAIQNAYQGFAKQNYTMLDNLKLGYGGTKTEMERLLSDAEKLTGQKYDISNLNDVYQAIHVIQGELGITGTTAKEASGTISGSMNSAKAAFQNFLSGQGGIEQVISTFITAGKNIANAVVKLLPQVVSGIVQLIQGIIPLLPGLIKQLLPVLIQGVSALMIGIIGILPDLLNAIAEVLPSQMPVIIDAILQMIPMLIDMLPLFIKAGGQILGALLEGLIKSTPSILKGLWNILKSMISYVGKLPSSFANAGLNIMKGLWNGIKGMKDWVINKVKSMGKSILNGLKSALGIHSPSTEFALVGKYSILGYTEGLEKMRGQLEDSIYDTFAISPQLASSSALHYSPNVIVNNQMNMSTDPLGQTVAKIKTFAGGAKNDYNYGMGV